jgi:tetratricopeptide (TPR) repeat protein
MSLRDAENQFAGRKKPGGLRPDKSLCPREPDMLAYVEDRLEESERERMDSHFIRCADCREFLAVFTQVSDALDPETEPLADEEVRAQTAKVIAAIKEDSDKYKLPPSHKGFYVSYRQLAAAAAIIATMALALVYFMTREPSADQLAMQSLALAMQERRRVEPRISGGLPWSVFSSTRGEESSDRLRIRSAVSRMSFAESPSAPQKDRMVLARAYLASGDRRDAERALLILSEIISSTSPKEAINDTGVALYQLGRYDEAVAAFERALEKSPGYEESLFNKALAEDRAGRREDSRRDWTEFINKSSDADWRSEAQRYLDSTRQ